MAKFWLVALAVAPGWVLSPPPNFSNAIAFKRGSVEVLSSLARSEDKLLFVHFSASWCQPCHWLERNTFTDETLAAFVHERFVPVLLSAADPQTAQLCKLYQVEVMPTVLVLDGNGKLLARYEETSNAAGLLMQLRVLLREREEPTRPYVFHNPRLMEMTEVAEASIAPPTASLPPLIAPEPGRTVSVGNFSIQLGVFSEYGNAIAYARSVEASLPGQAQVFLSEAGEKDRYKVVYGFYPTEEEALAMQERFRRQLGRGLVRPVEQL